MHTLIQDLRYGLRGLAKSPGFTAVAVVTLALGIGANTAMFNVVNSLILHPLPYRDPDRLATLWQTNATFGSYPAAFCGPDYVAWRSATTAFDSTAAFQGQLSNLTGVGEPERLAGWAVTPSLFPMLDARTMLGRTFLPEEEQGSRSAVVLISQKLWRRRFASDPAIVGKSVKLDDRPYTVVGVMPASFDFPNTAEFWVPAELGGDCSNATLQVVGRLKKGVTMEHARQESALIVRRLDESHHRSNSDSSVTVRRLEDEMAGELRPTLQVLFGAVGLVLLIACANVANLLLARATSRQRETAIRSALGASRGRLLRQMLTESLLLSSMGAAAGILLAVWGRGVLVGLLPYNLSSPGVVTRVATEGANAWVLGFTVVAAAFAGLAGGLAPALQASRCAPGEALKSGGRLSAASPGRHRLRELLLVTETALALPLLVGSVLLLRSFFRLAAVDPGFNAHQLLTLNVALPEFRYRDSAQMVEFEASARERLAAAAGVQAAGTIFGLPMGEIDVQGDFRLEGQTPIPEGVMATKEVVGGDYFRAMGVPLLKGRFFSSNDGPQSPCVALVNDAFARRFWTAGDAVGKRVDPGFSKSSWCTIVGVVGTVKQWGLDEQPRLAVFLPYAQAPAPFLMRHLTFVVRTALAPASLIASATKAVQTVDPELPVSDVATMEQLLYWKLAEPRLRTVLLAVFAGLALVLSSVGIYGVTSYVVSERTREFGVRMALGAERRDVLRLVVGQGMRLALAGVAAGLVGAATLTRFLAAFLYGVPATDLATFAGATVLLAGVVLLASLIPARRATKVDPMVALRYE